MRAIKKEKEKRGMKRALFSLGFQLSLTVTSILDNNVKDATNKIIFLLVKKIILTFNKIILISIKDNSLSNYLEIY